MAADLRTRIGAIELKNPLIAASAEHLIDADNVRRALRAGAGAVVVKSTNEVQAAKDQLDRAEYMVLDDQWRPTTWGREAPVSSTIACRSGLHPLPFDRWLAQCAELDREARSMDSYAVASIILGDLTHAVDMARQIQDAGIRVMELNIGTPYASQAAKGAVSTELLPERVHAIVSAVRAAIDLPLWVKVTGQSERVPDLAAAAFDAGGDSVVMAGRLLGLVPDVESMTPFLGTSLGIGGYWNLPLTCHWLASSRAKLGKDRALIGINGAQSGLDIARMMLAGASAVGIASPIMMRGFELIEESLAEFATYLERKNVSAADLVGRAADTRQSFAAMTPLPGRWRDYVPSPSGSHGG